MGLGLWVRYGLGVRVDLHNSVGPLCSLVGLTGPPLFAATDVSASTNVCSALAQSLQMPRSRRR